MSSHQYFRLFDMPYELVEDISFFFNWREAHKLLTVSRTFHDLFSRRVWRKFDSRMVTLPEPTRTMALARYGNFVREFIIDIRIWHDGWPGNDKDVSIYDTISAFSSVTKMSVDIAHILLFSHGLQYVNTIMCFPNLYYLYCRIESDNEPYDLITLAHAINYRQGNHNMNHIEYLNLLYAVREPDNPWTRLSSFVQMVSGYYVKNIKIKISFIAPAIPSPCELQILRKHFVDIPFIEVHEDTQFCYAPLNRSLHWNLLIDLNSCCYPQLRKLSIRTCCMSSDTYDYCDIAPYNFPCLQTIIISGHECNNMVANVYPPAWKKVLLQRWPHLNALSLLANMTCEPLVTILDYQSKLTTLVISPQQKILYENNTFNLATILPLLPKLQSLTIYGINGMRFDHSPECDDSGTLARSQLYFVWFDNLDVSTRILKLIFSLPKLNKISVRNCRFYSIGASDITNIENLLTNSIEIETVDDDDDDNDGDVYEELVASLHSISEKYSFYNPCSIKMFQLWNSEDDYEWPLDTTLEMIALMPRLQIFTPLGETDEIARAVKARFPYLNAYFT
ncbi:hypothetical protein GQ42DRAFT_8337 [Ramicandelaber brevisporus]|nr:hypothetical protein GQ42DRAFT_8337 [Ramicandelaber brevisporus]